MGEYSHITNIINNYKNMEKEIVEQLNYKIDHGTTSGSNREYVWKNLFERIIPKKFNIDRSVFIMDSVGNISKEVDLVIYDEQYTPYIFRYGTIKFIPIEAVAAVIECKSRSAKGDDLSRWLESINKLSTGTNSIVRINGLINYGINLDKDSHLTQTSTTPIKILCHMGITKRYTKNFDIVIKASKKGLNIEFNKSYKNLYEWYLQLNHYGGLDGERKKQIEDFIEKNIKHDKKYKRLKGRSLQNYEIDKGNTILSFIFQFNQLLMLINNPLFFPHLDYVDMFNKMNELDKK